MNPDTGTSAPERERELASIADRHRFGVEAVREMYRAVRAGHGTMAQFDHAEFTGSGQWMRGGMTMVAGSFDETLKRRIDALCTELAALAPEPASRAQPSPTQERSGESMPGRVERPAARAAEAPGQTAEPAWWPPELQWPTSSGSQGGMRYAYFADARRLAIEQGGQVTVYDTLDHRIGGVSQQQSYSRALTFSGARGPVDLGQLPVVSRYGAGA